MMKKLVPIVGAALVCGIMTGCQSASMGEKVSTWQNERPYAEKIKEVRAAGRKLQNTDVNLVFTIEDFKKELPECAASLDAVIAVGNTALNIVAEIGNTSSPLYVAAVDSVDRKWAMYVGRDVETDAGGDIEKYLEKVEPEFREQTRKDWEAYQKIIKYVPDPAMLARGKTVYERNLKTDDAGAQKLDIVAIEALQYSAKPEDKTDYSAFLVYRDNTPEVQKLCDNAILDKLNALSAMIQLRMQELMEATQKLSQDPEVSKLDFVSLGKTLKGVGVGIGKAFEDPLSKVASSINGFSLASEIDDLVAKTQNVENAEAAQSKKD